MSVQDVRGNVVDTRTHITGQECLPLPICFSFQAKQTETPSLDSPVALQFNSWALDDFNEDLPGHIVSAKNLSVNP
jgi:hypothetical protein